MIATASFNRWRRRVSKLTYAACRKVVIAQNTLSKAVDMV